MRKEILLHYTPGTSVLHRTDARAKLLSLGILTAGVMSASAIGIGLIAATLFTASIIARIGILRLLKESKGFIVFLIILCAIVVARERNIITGLAVGSLYSGRLLLVMLAGQIFVASTTNRELQHAIGRLLRPAGSRFASQLAASIALTFSLLPRILDTVENVRIAALSRCLDARHHPLHFTRHLSISASIRSLMQVETITRALEVRGFDANRAAGRSALSSRDWIVLSISLAVVMVVFIIR